MSIIGQQIKKYRMAEGITQEQLGQRLGVTTQAVSKWERGGTPDAELLPKLSDMLGVSIDALFGREQQSLTLSLAQKIRGMASEEAFRYAFSICWVTHCGLLQDADLTDDYINLFLDYRHFDEDKVHHFSRIFHDGGMATARIAPDFHHLFLMMEPQSGLKKQLLEPEQLRRVFAIFADKSLLSIIYCLYTRPNSPIATSLISKKTGMTIQEVDRCMDVLLENDLVKCTAIATAEGEIYSYLFNQESSVIPLLCFADEMARKDNMPIIQYNIRTKPLL